MPIEFKYPQYPIRLALAMTIHKSQGQLFSVFGLDELTIFDLYIAINYNYTPQTLNS